MNTRGCPHLGLRSDANTFTAFPSNANYCHRVAPVGAIDQAHQRNCCLTPDYVNCPVYMAGPAKELPVEIRSPIGEQERQRGIGRVVLVLVLVGVAAVFLFLGWQNWRQINEFLAGAAEQAGGLIGLPATPSDVEPSSTPPVVGFVPVPTRPPSATPTISPTRTPTPTPTNTATPTLTPIPTLTPTMIVTPTLPATPAASALLIVERANIRSGPGPEFAVLGVVLRSEQYEITGRNSRGDWWQVCCTDEGATGWLFGELVVVQGDAAAVPIVESAPPASD